MTKRGGARPGSGRKIGGKNKATIEREIRAKSGIEAALESGVMPLDILLTVMRGGPDAAAISERQVAAATAAAPYLHARINTLRGDPAAPLAHVHSITDIVAIDLTAALAGWKPPGK